MKSGRIKRHMKFIISAGGQGTKLWPFSREDNPKQFQKIIDGESMYVYNIKVLLKKYSAKDIFVSTKKRYLEIAQAQLPEIPLENYIIEPDVAKNRGPADGLALIYLDICFPNEPFMIVQSDCIRIPESNYLNLVSAAEELVIKHKKFLSGGIKPTYPVLGVDYLKLGNKLESVKGVDAYEVQEYVDRKSNQAETEELINTNDVFIHSNHNSWYPGLMLEAYSKYRPDWYEILMKMKKKLEETKNFDSITELYNQMESGATELVTKHIFKDGIALKLNYNWVDIGTWNSLYENFAKKDQVYKEGNVVAIDSKSSLIKEQNPDKLIAVFGLQDMVVVDTEDILLILPKDMTDRVKDIQEELKNQNLDKYL